MTEADRLLRQYEAQVRMERRAEALSQANGTWDAMERLEENLAPGFVDPAEVENQKKA